MQSQARTLTLIIAVLVVTITALLIGAAPQEPAFRAEEPSRPSDQFIADEPEGPPISFADSDGQDLILEELSVKTAIHGMLSLTEIDFRFRNPQSRTIEGRFTCTLPPNATISRFAKDVSGHLMEGEVVERLRANQVYEQFLHQMRDPALLEQEQGNRFSARIFPIEANAPVHLVLSYTQLLPLNRQGANGGRRTWTFPLRGLNRIGKFTFSSFVTPLPEQRTPGVVTRTTAEVSTMEEADWTPDRDLALDVPAGASAHASILRSGDFYLAAFRPALAHPKTNSPTRWSFYVDTSASSAEGAPNRIRALETVLASLPAHNQVDLLAFDQDVIPLGSGTAGELSRTAAKLIQGRLFLGGTDLGALLTDVARVLKDDSQRGVVLVSDLTPTLGRTASPELQPFIAALPARVVVHALILGSREDAAVAKAITSGRGRIVRIPFTETLAVRAREAASELQKPLGGTLELRDGAAEWIYPFRFEDVQPGDEVIAVGRLKAGRDPEAALTSASGPARVSFLRSSTFGPLLEREAYRGYLEYLARREAEETEEAVRKALAAEQVRISIEQRVVIPRTTMLVLESEADYARFGLDRRALAAILTIEAGGIGRIDRERGGWTPPPVAPMPRRITAEQAKRTGPRPATQARPEPGPVGEDLPAALSEADDERVSGGVEGGVVGGVVGGVPGGAMAASTTRAFPATTEAPLIVPVDTQAADARIAPPPPPPPPAMLRRRESRDPDAGRPDWVSRSLPSRDAITGMRQQLRNNPRDRELYNQLSEALAALAEWSELRTLALQWQPYDPENPQVYEVLGMAADALDRDDEAARAFASLIEVAPGKTELLQRAGLLLLRTRRASLAEAPLRRALELRPDRANAYRHLALLLWREGRIEEATRVLETATRQQFPAWYRDVQRVIREELAMLYRAWLKKDPARRAEIEERAREHRANLTRTDALRLTLAWETDANDVDLHVVDPAGEEVYYSHRESRSGLQLYEDITQGLGPEVVRTARVDRGTYHVGVRYFASGPMGISRGIVIVMRNDEVEIHPFRLTRGGEAIRYVTAVTVK